MALIDLVKSKVKDDGERLTDLDDYLPSIAAALERYSKHRPDEDAADLAGSGGHDLALPEAWIEGFSRVVQVEYPVDQVPEEILPAGHWKLYRSPAGLKLRLPYETPSAAESVRVTFTVTREEATVVDGDLDAVACLAAAICLRTLAAAYAQTSDSSIQADVVNYQSKADQYRRLADSLEGKYNDHLGIDPKGGVPAASSIAAATPSERVRLTHR